MKKLTWVAGVALAAGLAILPELAQDAPVFAEFGARFKEPWLAHWINHPHALRPGALMPRIFPGEGDAIDPRAADLAAFLASLGTAPEAKPLPEDAAPLGGASAFRVVPEGGNIRFLNTVELQFPISKSFLGLPMVWSGALFFDSGAIVNGLDQFRWQDLRHSVGISLLRLITPVGPLSIEYAYPLTQTLAEERWKTAPWYTHFPGRIHFNWGIPLSRL